jgi:uncharacterized protein YcbK (DUF882 family)
MVTNRGCYYRSGDVDGSLTELWWSSRPPLQLVMTKHLGFARPGLVRNAKSLRGKTSSYAIATLTALTLLFGAGAAQAAHIAVTRTPHPRRIAANVTGSQEPLPSNSHSKSKLSAVHTAHKVEVRTNGKTTVKKSSARPLRKAVADKLPTRTGKSQARSRRHKTEEQREPVAMNRVSLHHEPRSESRSGPRRNARHEDRMQVAERHAAPVPNAPLTSDHELTSADFLNATVANTTVTSIVLKTPAKQAAPIAHVESNEPFAARPVTTEDAAPTSDELAYLTHPSHQELSEEVAIPMVLPGLYRNGRLIVPAPLKGTHEILVHQNLMADDEGLERIQDDNDLARLRAAHQLVNFPESASLHVNPELSADRRCARVWTVRFAADIARQYYARFGQPLQVNSAVRTIAYQLRLQRVNGNAAGIGGDVASPHLTGQAIDFGKSGMSIAQIAWMRAYLKPLMDNGKLDVEEEFQQACFHISVYRSYLPNMLNRPKTEFATLHTPKATAAMPRVDRGDQ